MKVVAQNRRAKFDYTLLETVEAGIVLSGQEAKSCRQGLVNLAGAYVSFVVGRPRIKKMKIAPYPYAGPLPDYDPEQDRALLIKKSEFERLQAATSQQGVTIIPLEVRAGKFIKLVLAVAQGRKKLDKRAAIKERETSRRIREGREI